MPRSLYVFCLLCLAPSAHAYLDPASGSLLLQLLVGGIAGVAVILKLTWHRLLGFLGLKKRDHDQPPDSPS